MIATQGLEQALFDPASVDPETAAPFCDSHGGEELEARLSTVAPPYVVGIQAVREEARSFDKLRTSFLLRPRRAPRSKLRRPGD